MVVKRNKIFGISRPNILNLVPTANVTEGLAGVGLVTEKLAGWLKPFRNGPPREIRTPDTQVRSLVLYPAELWADRN